MRHRHLELPADLAVERLPSVAVVDLLERGDLDDWLPLVRACLVDPTGPLAERVRRLVDDFPVYGVSPLLRRLLALEPPR